MKKFYIGMDIGTNSVGMACTDEEYNLLRAKRHDLWTVRLFDEAETAKNRRISRTVRRRFRRRRFRIDLLQELFAPYLSDDTFFLRLNNSALYAEDKAKEVTSKHLIFTDESMTDKDFYRRYPTIYHLRQALIEGKEQNDLRLYYLAVHHIVKYRGHFLQEGQDNFESANDICSLFVALNEALSDRLSEISFDENLAERFQQICLTAKGKTERKQECLKLFGAKTSAEKEAVQLLCGASAAVYKFLGEQYREEGSISFTGMTDEVFDGMADVYGEDFGILQAMREIHQNVELAKILKGERYVSVAMMKRYKKHEEDLKTLKALILKEFGHEEYVRFFKSTHEKSNYVNYIGYTKTAKGKVNVSKCKAEDFFDYTKKFLQPKKDAAQAILDQIDNGEFLPKISNADNGLFPYQLNFIELKEILRNMVRDYPETKAITDKILSIFTFKIPYYVGPLNAASPHAWIVKRSEEKIYPWNFDQIVDKAASGEAFMRNLTKKCTYLYGEDVLPKGSMIYQSFETLNQINKLRIDDTPITVEQKQSIFCDLFLAKKKVSVRDLRNYFVERGWKTVAEAKAMTIGGIDNEFTASMSSYLCMREILGDRIKTNVAMIEEIILWHTLHTDKKNVKALMKAKYGNILDGRTIDRLAGLNQFRKFGRLSKKFLCELFGNADPVTGEVHSILDLLYQTNANLNEILFDEKYDFEQMIRAENGGREQDPEELIEKLSVSPAVRRGIRQTLKMTEEYISAVGRAPDKIFIEVTRDPDEKKERKDPRRKKLTDLMKGAERIVGDINDLMDELNEKNDSDLRRERLYLYFLQLGRCAYTGERIRLDELNEDLYDVDHILPRSYTKDDSLDNKVLVKKVKNKEKTDIYPLPVGFTNQQQFWKQLKDQGLMSKQKYARLIRTEPLTEEDFRGFINRQKVITDQTAKAVAELMKLLYPQTKIVYSKAKYVDDFKNQFKLIKCRETNDLHHARDAYLNIVVGNVYDTKFGDVKNFFYLNKNQEQREASFKYLFRYDINGAWYKETTLANVQKIYQRTSMTVTRYTYEGKGKLFDATVYPKTKVTTTIPHKGKCQASIPRKSAGALSNIEKYGGYTSSDTAYFCVVQSLDKKGQPIKTIESISVLLANQVKRNKNAVREYLESILNEPKILVEKLLPQTLLDINGMRVRIAGISGNQICLHNAVQWHTSAETDRYVNALLKVVDWDTKKLLTEKEKTEEEIPVHTNRFGDRKVVVNREQNVQLFDLMTEKLKEPFYNGGFATETFLKKLQNGREVFVSLTVLEQCKTLLQIVRFFKCNAELSNLSAIAEKAANCGKMVINKNITEKSITVIHQSPCGLSERQYRL